MLAVIESAEVMSITYGTRRCWASDEMAAMCAEWKAPVSTWAPAPISRSASERATSTFVSLSASRSSSFAPPIALIPPAALMASAASWAPRRQSPPTSAMAPLIGLTTPTLMVLGCAWSGRDSATAPAAPPASERKRRRLMRLALIVVPPDRDGLTSSPRAPPGRLRTS